MAKAKDWRNAKPELFTRMWWRRLAGCFPMAGRDFLVDNGFHWAGAMAFYSLLSALPLLVLVVSLLGNFADRDWAAQQITERLRDFLPHGEEEVREIVVQALDRGGGTGMVNILILAWSGSYVFAALTTALNLAFDVDETYGFLKRTLLRFAMLGTVGLLFALALFSRPVISVLWQTVEKMPAWQEAARTVLAAGLPAVLMIVSLFLIYRLVPRTRPAWSVALAGAVFATLLFVLSRVLFISYLGATMEDFNILYGPLTLGVVLLFWAWVVAIIVLLGGELTAVLHSVLIKGMTFDEVLEHHLDRSPTERQRGKT
ncbi:N/A [soil metagenome]